MLIGVIWDIIDYAAAIDVRCHERSFIGHFLHAPFFFFFHYAGFFVDTLSFHFIGLPVGFYHFHIASADIIYWSLLIIYAEGHADKYYAIVAFDFLHFFASWIVYAISRIASHKYCQLNIVFDKYQCRLLGPIMLYHFFITTSLSYYGQYLGNNTLRRRNVISLINTIAIASWYFLSNIGA